MCLPIIGGVISGIGAAMGVKAQADSLKAQSAFEHRQAQLERMSGTYKSERQREQLDRVLGQQRAGFAANGVAMDGSAFDVAADTEREGDLDIQAIQWNSKLAADNLNYKGKVSAANAKAISKQAPISFITPVISGLAQFGSSFGS